MTLRRIIRSQPHTTVLQTIARVLLATLLLATGLGRLTFARSAFLAQAPPWLSLDGDLVVVLSGIVEIALGAGLLALPRYRVLLVLWALWSTGAWQAWRKRTP